MLEPSDTGTSDVWDTSIPSAKSATVLDVIMGQLLPCSAACSQGCARFPTRSRGDRGVVQSFTLHTPRPSSWIAKAVEYFR
jgi:hypothetical protein